MRVWVGAILFWFYVAAVQSTQAADDNFLAAQQYYVSPPQGGFVEVAARIQQQSGTTAPAALKHRIVVKDGARTIKVFQGGSQAADLGALVYVPTSGTTFFEFQQSFDAGGSWFPYYLSSSPAFSATDKTTAVYESNNAVLTFIWAEELHSLGVRIKTRDAEGAGTSNQVWFDAGFRSWQLEHPGKQFARGQVDEFLNLELPFGGLTTDDIIKARLEKKGTFVAGGTQWTGAPDLFAGEGQPESITLLVNGRAYNLADPISVPSGTKLKHDNPSWEKMLRPLSTEDRLAWGLRVVINDTTGRAGEIVSGFTTIFKEHGLSGWQPGPLKTDPQLSATVVGTLRHPSSPGTDGFVSLDLELDWISVSDGRWIALNNPGDVPHPRFVRIEDEHEGDHRHEHWAVGDRFQISGAIKWDTDKGGFYEVHPAKGDASSVQQLGG